MTKFKILTFTLISIFYVIKLEDDKKITYIHSLQLTGSYYLVRYIFSKYIKNSLNSIHTANVICKLEYNSIGVAVCLLLV